MATQLQERTETVAPIRTFIRAAPRLASRCGPVVAMRSAGRLVPIGGPGDCKPVLVAAPASAS